MRKLLGYFIVSAALVLSGVWVAAQVNLIEFAPNTLIESSEVNQNFDALNDGLAALNEGKQNRVTGECDAGSSIRVVNEDGSVECETDDSGGSGSAGVQSLNGQTGAISLQAGSNIVIDDSTNGQIIISATSTSASPIPAGAVMSFNLDACPDGWSIFGQGIGRTVVGLAQGGTLAGTIGDPLSDLESPKHAHQVFLEDLTLSEGTSEAGNHQHLWSSLDDRGLDGGDWRSGDGELMIHYGNGMDTDGDGNFMAGTQDDDVDHEYFTSANGTHTHSVSVFIPGRSADSSISSGHLPYVQLLMCQKN